MLQGHIAVSRYRSYLGKVEVGEMDKSQVNQFWEVLQGVPVRRGDIRWNCQDWIAQALVALKSRGFAVKALAKDALASILDGAL